MSCALKTCFKMYIFKIKQYKNFHECWLHEDTQQLLSALPQVRIIHDERQKDCTEYLKRILMSCLVNAYLESYLFDQLSSCVQIGDMKFDEHTINYDMLSILGVLTNNGKINIIESCLVDKRPIYKADLILRAIVSGTSNFTLEEQTMMKSLLTYDQRKELRRERDRREKPTGGGRCLPNLGLLRFVSSG